MSKRIFRALVNAPISITHAGIGHQFEEIDCGAMRCLPPCTKTRPWVYSEANIGREIAVDVFSPPAVESSNPKDLLGISKPQLNLIPPASLIYQALAMQLGAAKYGAFNWRSKKVIASIYVAATMRHLLKFLDGQDTDEESGYPELGHALACLGILADAKETGNLIDDRPVKGPASALLAQYTKKREGK